MRASTRLPTLDGLRAIAVGIVMLAHSAPSAGAPHWLAIIARFLPGKIGVQIFFTISGFIITHLLIREYEREGRISLSGFWYRRALRILPPLVVLLLSLQALSMAGWVRVDEASQWASLFFLRNHVIGGWFNGHLWSLSVEEQFYLAWPLVMVALLARGWRFPFRCVVLATIAVRTLLAWRGYGNLVAYGLVGNVDALMLGCWGAWHWAGKTAWPSRFFNHVARLWPLMLALIAGLGFASTSRYALLAHAIEPAMVGCVTIALIIRHLQPSDSLLFRALNARWVELLGRMSYSLYLWQQLFLCPSGAWARDPSWAVVLPVNILCATLMACLSYRLVELPVLRFRSR